MSRHSAKAIYALTKYSKAVLKVPGGTQFSQEASQRAANIEWQHYSQPNIRLLVEHNRSASGVAESIRLRIVWTVEKTTASTATSGRSTLENIVLEDVDLVAIRRHIHPFPIHGLPLRAVYRGNMIGIRYLPTQAGSNMEHRRFQINFLSSGDADALIQIIQDVCPCKQNPPTSNPPVQGSSFSQLPAYTQPNPRTDLGSPMNYQNNANSLCVPEVSNYLGTQSQSGLNTNYNDLPAEFSVPATTNSNLVTSSSQVSPLIPQVTQFPSNGSSNCLSPSSPHPTQYDLWQFHPSYLPSVSSPLVQNIELNSNNASLPSSSTAHEQTLLTPPPSRSQRPRIVNNEILTPDPTQTTTQDNGRPQSSLHLAPNSDQAQSQTQPESSVESDPTSSSTLVAMPSTQTAPATDKTLLSSLYESPSLSHLSRQELEDLVTHIIREEGFVKLLEEVDSFWRLKGLVNM